MPLKVSTLSLPRPTVSTLIARPSIGLAIKEVRRAYLFSSSG
jgi:hypothetical protein